MAARRKPAHPVAPPITASYARLASLANPLPVARRRAIELNAPKLLRPVPMGRVSPKSGKQFVVLSDGGSRQSPDRGDYVIADALRGAP